MKIHKEFVGLCINFDASKYNHLNAHALYKVVVDDDYEHPTFEPGTSLYLNEHKDDPAFTVAFACVLPAYEQLVKMCCAADKSPHPSPWKTEGDSK